MAVIKLKPTSPGRRAVVKVVHAHLHKGKPEASLLEPQKQNAGRNNNGHITIRHKGGGHKHHYRVVDFVRAKDGIMIVNHERNGKTGPEDFGGGLAIYDVSKPATFHVRPSPTILTSAIPYG